MKFYTKNREECKTYVGAVAKDGIHDVQKGVNKISMKLFKKSPFNRVKVTSYIMDEDPIITVDPAESDDSVRVIRSDDVG